MERLVKPWFHQSFHGFNDLSKNMSLCDFFLALTDSGTFVSLEHYFSFVCKATKFLQEAKFQAESLKRTSLFFSFQPKKFLSGI